VSHVEWVGDEKHVRARRAGADAGFDAMTEGAEAAEVCVVLREDWAQTPVLAGDVLNVITPGRVVDWSAPVVVDNGSGMVVLQPDVLVSGTTVSESFPCRRRAVLRESMQAGSSSVAAVKGNLAHELLQSAMLSGDFRPATLEKLLRKVIAEHCDEIFAVGAKLAELRQFLRALTRPMADFHAQMSGTTVQMGGTKETLAVTEVADIEENIWSPMLGLKGKVDATLRVKLGDDKAKGAQAPQRSHSYPPVRQPLVPRQALPPAHVPYVAEAGAGAEGTAGTILLPLEIKTGKTYINHRAQVILYTLLLGDRYPDDTVRRGLLLYVRAAAKAEAGNQGKPKFDKFKGSEVPTASLKPPCLPPDALPYSCHPASLLLRSFSLRLSPVLLGSS
jgi:DNA replication ATP-dependent helicase Dna2